MALNNLSILKTNKARAIRFSTLNAVCAALECTPRELIEYVPDNPAGRQTQGTGLVHNQEYGPSKSTPASQG
ncbi:MAG: helix-turn-helix domain-containing protein [Candidatus Hydrogenedentes bacterium]|nr:helix-turn-helix domain-containing protein [Candidatus Hydrogenedentota bacterium]